MKRYGYSLNLVECCELLIIGVSLLSGTGANGQDNVRLPEGTSGKEMTNPLLFATNYYWSKASVPLPLDLDYSHDAWRKLTFWKEFAKQFQETDLSRVPLVKTNDPKRYRLQQAIREHRIYVGGHAIPMNDRLWMEARDQCLAQELAVDAAIMAKQGLSFAELREWISNYYTNYYDADPIKTTVLDYMTNNVSNGVSEQATPETAETRKPNAGGSTSGDPDGGRK